MLTQREVVQYLLRHKLVSEESIVEGDLMVVDVSRRNRNFRIISGKGPCYLIKQGIAPAAGISSIAHEAAVYEHLQSGTNSDGICRYIPRLYGFDPDEGILILGHVREAQNLREYHARKRGFPPSVAAALGSAISELHRQKQINENKGNGDFSHQPWILYVHRPDLKMFHDASSASIQIMKIVQQFPEFCDSLDELCQEWQRERLIHFDMKWDNCLVSIPPGGGRKLELRIVDWELAAMGDPCWDIGSVFMDYLSFWLLSTPITRNTPPDRFLELARYPLNSMQPAIRAFWRSYIRSMKLDTIESNKQLVRSTKYAAARLVQTAFEQMQMSPQLTANVVYFLQLSLNILRRPQDAIVQLLGIRLPNMDLP